MLENARKTLLTLVAQKETNDITVRQFLVLLSLVSKPRTVRDISNEVRLTKPAVSRAADWLDAIGFAKRIKDPNDRRSVLVVLLPKGKRFLEQLETISRQ